jgi:predicted phage-related endonuclease
MPAILGFSRFANAYDIWLLKTRRVVPQERTEQYIQAGTLFEEAVLKWCSRYLEEPLITPSLAYPLERTIDDTPIKVHLDALVERTGAPAESKTAGLFGPVQTIWGESGTDDVPEYECIQAHCHMMATDHEICHVPVFLGGRGFQYFYVQRDNAIVDLIKRTAIQFWQEHVLRDVPPADDAVPTLAMAKQIRRVEGDPVELDAKAVQEWLDSREAASAAAKAKDFHSADIRARLDGVAIGYYEVKGDDGKLVKRYVTNYDQTRKGIQRKALLADHPEIHDKYYQPGKPFGVLRPCKDPFKGKK